MGIPKKKQNDWFPTPIGRNIFPFRVDYCQIHFQKECGVGVGGGVQKH